MSISPILTFEVPFFLGPNPVENFWISHEHSWIFQPDLFPPPHLTHTYPPQTLNNYDLTHNQCN